VSAMTPETQSVRIIQFVNLIFLSDVMMGFSIRSSGSLPEELFL